METANKLIYKQTNYFKEDGEKYRIIVTISLDDDCHNNICDWGITADIRRKNKYGRYEEYMGGCCHGEIAKYVPELAKFIPLHCCNHYGAPMYPVENGTYYIKNSDKSSAIEYLRISDKEYSKLSEAVDDKMYFKYLLFNLGIVDRWKRESDELLVELEDLCGKKWVNPYKLEEEKFTLILTDKERSFIEERIEAGYYSIENIEKRREETHNTKMMKERAKICELYDKQIRKAEVGKCPYELALKLHELGVNSESEFYFVKEMKGGGTQIDSVVQNTMRYSYRKEGDLIPAYMSHELGEILPSMINVSKSKIWDDWLQLTQYFPNKDSEYYETAYVRYDVYDSQTEVYSGFGDTEVESRAMLLIDLLDKKVLTLSDLNLN